MPKYFGVDSFQIAALTTTARRLQTTVDGKRFVQSAIIQSPLSNSGNILVGGPDAQVFAIVPGAALNLGDLYLGSKKSEIDMYNVWVKSSTGTVVVNVLFDKSYTEA